MKAWTDGFTITPVSLGRRSASRICVAWLALAPRLGCSRLALARSLAAAPMRLRVDLGRPQAASLAPRAGDRFRGPSEVGDHAAGAAAGHTLPRLMGPLAQVTPACSLLGVLAF
jgi:hypothetical protein